MQKKELWSVKPDEEVVLTLSHYKSQTSRDGDRRQRRHRVLTLTQLPVHVAPQAFIPSHNTPLQFPWSGTETLPIRPLGTTPYIPASPLCTWPVTSHPAQRLVLGNFKRHRVVINRASDRGFMTIYGGQKQVFALAETLFCDRVHRPSVSEGGG